MNVRFADQEFIPAGSPLEEVDRVMAKHRSWDAVVNLGILPPDDVGGGALAIQHKSISDWFQWQVAHLTGGAITADTDPFDIRTKICMVESLLQASVDKGETEDTVPGYPLKHTFADGVYVREISIPAGHMVVGKIHRHEHLNFISKGRVTVITEQGGVEELVAPVTMISPPGVKRLLFTHEDTVWTTVHVTNERDLDKIEEQVIAKKFTDMGLEQPDLNTTRRLT